MKLIEALKKLKDFSRKFNDLRDKIATYCAVSSVATPAYPDQGNQVNRWMQSCRDIIKEMLRIRLAIQKTNLATDVTVVIDGKSITQSIAAWIHRRRDLSQAERSIYEVLTDKGIKEGPVTSPSGEKIDIKLIRYYDVAYKDEQMEILAEEPSLIDGRLEIANAITDLIW